MSRLRRPPRSGGFGNSFAAAAWCTGRRRTVPPGRSASSRERKPTPPSRPFSDQWNCGPIMRRPGKRSGVVYASREDFERAETPFRNACERQPSLPDACLYYGRTLYLLNRFQPAIPVLRPDAAKGPRQRRGVPAARAYRWKRSGKPPSAGEAFRQAVRLTSRLARRTKIPASTTVYSCLARDRPSRRVEPLEGALKRHPDAGRAHTWNWAAFCWPWIACPRPPLTWSEPSRWIRGSGRAHLLLGKVYLRLGKTEAAEEHLRQGSRTVK